MKEVIFAALPWIIIGLVLIGYFVKRDRLKRNKKVSDYRTEGMCFGCAIGATNIMNMQLFAPLFLVIQLYDGGMSSAVLKEHLKKITKDFEERWMRNDQ